MKTKVNKDTVGKTGKVLSAVGTILTAAVGIAGMLGKSK